MLVTGHQYLYSTQLLSVSEPVALPLTDRNAPLEFVVFTFRLLSFPSPFLLRFCLTGNLRGPPHPLTPLPCPCTLYLDLHLVCASSYVALPGIVDSAAI
ncbi:hypothetical protein IF1G_05682 [Cordyceps javanica]|uniref:Uncharacterized protein n=1 Tax=Cordyceps javanica TaxID=43265 RepID=A0A545V2D0_9HYPO|nr:hypothetical protein IF1G_05682 [Cordyceps javanica]